MKRKFSLIILNLIQIISSIYIFAKPNLLDSIVYTYMEGEGGPAALLAGTMIFWFSIFSIILSGIIIFEVFKNDENKFTKEEYDMLEKTGEIEKYASEVMSK